MAARLIQLLRMSCNVCMILHLCSLQGVNCDVPDGVVYTDLHKTAEKGDKLVLKCQFYETPIAVYWKKGDEPTKSPNLITWVEGESPSGSCVHDGSCHMSNEFSLIIRNITISDQGTYICRVSNYKGILIHNFTSVNVFAPPVEPFPLIDECRGILPNYAQQTCSLSTSDSVTITCSASSYYPDIDLFFLHGSEQMNVTNIKEDENMDGTRNKSISTVAEPSESPYVCVASDIPGSHDQKTVTITVTFLGSTVAMTISSNQTTLSPGGSLAKVVVPVTLVILILAALCVAIIIFWRRREKQRNQEKDDPESIPLRPGQQINGKVSFFELWYLVHNMDETNLNTLSQALSDLGIFGVEEELTTDKAYDLLCDWKGANKNNNEGMRLKDVLIGHGLDGSWKELCERRYDATSAVSEELLDHVLWNIGDEKKIRQFLRELITGKCKTRPISSGQKKDVNEESMVVLREWRDRVHNESQVIQLSLALERAKIEPVDRIFFKVPEHLLKAISPQEVEGFVYRLTGRHCKRLAKAVGITDEKKIETIMDENNEDLVLIQSMVNDWANGQECCNFVKRCRLDDATIKIGRHDMTDSFGTTSYRVKTGGIHKRPHPNAKIFNSSSIFDDDLVSLLKHLHTSAIPLFLEKLGMSVDKEGEDLEKLRSWRDQNIKESKRHSLQDLVLIHRDVLKKNDGHVLDLNDDELENVIASLTFTNQVEELTSRLGIKNEKEQSPLLKLKEWRDRCTKKNRRERLISALHAMELSGCIVDRLPANHVYQAEMVRLAWTMFATDIWPLVTLLDIDMNKEKTVGEPQMKGTVNLLLRLFEKSKDLNEHRRHDFCIAIRNLGYPDVARSAYFGFGASLSELCSRASGLSKDEMERMVDHLGLDINVISVCQGTTGAYDSIRLMKIWKDQLRPEPLHFKFKLASGLRAVGRTKVAIEILAGGYHTTEVDSMVVESICNSLQADQLERLHKHLGLKTWDDETTTTATLVTEWVRNWLRKFDKCSPADIINDMLDSREKKIDNLFRAGFLKLAEEVMLLEIFQISSCQAGQ